MGVSGRWQALRARQQTDLTRSGKRHYLLSMYARTMQNDEKLRTLSTVQLEHDDYTKTITRRIFRIQIYRGRNCETPSGKIGRRIDKRERD